MKYLVIVILSLLMFGACSEEKSDMTAEDKKVKFADLSFDEQLAKIVHHTETAKKGLAAKGEYNCCVMPTCNWCLINDKHCTCAIHLNKGEPVCGECGQAWAVGRGMIPGMDAEHVKWGPKEEHKH